MYRVIYQPLLILRSVLAIAFAFLIGTQTLWAQASHPPTASAEAESTEDLFELSLKQLSQIKVYQPATLTKTSSRAIPASVTRITAEQIRLTAARSLNELLEIYVPGLQYINHRFGFSHLGARGIMSDRDDKYLLKVNGRTMNERTLVGAISERDLNILGDIHHIDVIRGPGSATYGVGAVSMVINIVTFSADNFSGTEATTKGGYGEDFLSQEIKSAQRWDNGNQLFFYGGISEFRGADYEDAPLRFSAQGTDRLGRPISAEEDVNFDIGRDKQQYRDKPKLKLHLQLDLDALSIWSRYTRSGEQKPLGVPNIFQPPIGDDVVNFDEPLYPSNQLGVQQFTLVSEYKRQLNHDWQLIYHLSFDSIDYERQLTALADGTPRIIESFREDEYWTRLAFHFEPDSNIAAAFGMEGNHEKFGLSSPGFPDTPSSIPGFTANPDDWSTNTYSLFGEGQWLITDKVTGFLSGRIDDHTYTDTMLSPRLSLVFMPTDTNTLKFILARSQRMNFAVDMREEFIANNNRSSEPETLDNIEVRYEHIFDSKLSTAIVGYYEQLDLIGFLPEALENGPDNQRVIAEEEQWGLEWEVSWRTQKMAVHFSHAYLQLKDFDLRDGVARSFVTAMDNGYGDTLNNLSTNLSKLNGHYHFTDNWQGYLSLVYYWKFEGIRDHLVFRTDTRVSEGGIARYQDGNSEVYGSNIYLNLGAEGQLNEHITLGINGHNLLGLIEESYNKRNYFLSEGEYRIQAPSLSVSLSWQLD